MKIGKFATANDLTIDTIRHYMSLDLIAPVMRGSQYDFDERCQSDLSDILRLKSLGFTLQEIQVLMLFKRIGRLTDYEKGIYYQSMFKQKMSALTKHIFELESMKDKLAIELKTVELTIQEPKQTDVFGISFSFLPLITCFKCKASMILSEGSVINQKLISGTLTCHCGTQYSIVDGILIVHTEDLISAQTDEEQQSFYVEEYIQHTDYEYLNKLYKSFEWAYKNLPFETYDNKTLLELGVGHGFFLRYIYDKIPNSSRYIAIDHDMSRLKWLRNHLIITPMNFDLVLIACDFKKVPLRDKSVDVLLDISGSTNYAFDHPEFLLSKLTHLYNDECDLVATFLLFNRFSKNSKIEPYLRSNFKLAPVSEQIELLNFKKQSSYTSDSVTRGGKFEDFFVEGESIFSYIYHGKRWG